MGCLKHFPGQGDATIDTHVGSAHIPLSLSELEERELIPFRTLCNEASGVMISHCIYPALDNKEASLSSVVMEKLLRQSLGFQGLIISDDMMMGAIANDEISWKESIVESVANGADLVLVCQDLGRWILALEAIRAYQSKSRSFRRRLEFSAEKVLACRRLIS
jgi:beta-N-acetylhexosaminidase